MSRDNNRDHGMVVHLERMSFHDGNKRKTKLKIDPEDVIAIGTVLVAVIIAIGMVTGAVPINKYTAGIVAFSGSGAAIAGIVKSRKRKPTRTPWIEWIVILVLAVAFGAYVWASWGWFLAL